MHQILTRGLLEVGEGRSVDFSNTVMIMTSSIRFDLGEDLSYDTRKSLVMEELKRYLKSDFLKSLDGVIVFRPLTMSEVMEIANRMLKEVFERLEAQEIKLYVTNRFRERVAGEGYDRSDGARPMRGVIGRLVEDRIEEKMAAKEIKEGDVVLVDVDSDANVVVVKGKPCSPC